MNKQKLCENCAALFAGQVIYVPKRGKVVTGEVHREIWNKYRYIREIRPDLSQNDVIEYLREHLQPRYSYETIRKYISHKPDCVR